MTEIKTEYRLCSTDVVDKANLPLVLINQNNDRTVLYFVRDLYGQSSTLETFFKLSAFELLQRMPDLPEGKNTLLVLSAEEPEVNTDELVEQSWIYHAIYSYEIEDDTASGEELDIEIFSQLASEALNVETLTFSQELEINLSKEIVGALKANVQALVEHYKTVLLFTK